MLNFLLQLCAMLPWIKHLWGLDTSTLDDTVLRYGSPESVGLLPGPLLELERNVSGYRVPANYSSATYNEVHPIYPGATVIIGHRRTVVSYFADGHSLKYADVNGTELPETEQIETELNTRYDMASLTKVFTAVLALQQLEREVMDLNATVATYVPDFAVNDKENVTLLQLLTHTAGFPADPVPSLWSDVYHTYSERRAAILNTTLVNAPGTAYLYSDLSFMTLQIVLETITGFTLDVLLENELTRPLGLKQTYFNKGNVVALDRSNIAAVEFQNEPDRPQPVWGIVHDENAWSLNGVAGHAGVFSTAMDLGILCQMILNNGTYGGVEILRPESVDKIFYNYNAAFPGNEHGLGFELNQYYFSGIMQSLETAGHTGFTGTSLVIDRPSSTFMVLLTARVHPSREWSSPNIVRQMVGYFVSKALGRSTS